MLCLFWDGLTGYCWFLQRIMNILILILDEALNIRQALEKMAVNILMASPGLLTPCLNLPLTPERRENWNDQANYSAKLMKHGLPFPLCLNLTLQPRRIFMVYRPISKLQIFMKVLDMRDMAVGVGILELPRACCRLHTHY